MKGVGAVPCPGESLTDVVGGRQVRRGLPRAPVGPAVPQRVEGDVPYVAAVGLHRPYVGQPGDAVARDRDAGAVGRVGSRKDTLLGRAVSELAKTSAIEVHAGEVAPFEAAVLGKPKQHAPAVGGDVRSVAGIELPGRDLANVMTIGADGEDGAEVASDVGAREHDPLAVRCPLRFTVLVDARL